MSERIGSQNIVDDFLSGQWSPFIPGGFTRRFTRVLSNAIKSLLEPGFVFRRTSGTRVRESEIANQARDIPQVHLEAVFDDYHQVIKLT